MLEVLLFAKPCPVAKRHYYSYSATLAFPELRSFIALVLLEKGKLTPTQSRTSIPGALAERPES